MMITWADYLEELRDKPTKAASNDMVRKPNAGTVPMDGAIGKASTPTGMPSFKPGM